jgi:hypothetical protein
LSAAEEVGFREFRATVAGWNACWDQGSMRLLFTVGIGEGSTPIRLNLSSLHSFARDMTHLPEEKRRCFQHILETWPLSTSELPDSSWLAPFERMAFFLAARDWVDLIPAEAAHHRLIAWLRRQGSALVWLPRFDEDLSHATRYRLMRASVEHFAQLRETQREQSPLVDLSDPDTRQQYWFTVRMTHALAGDWCEAEGLSSTESTKALRQSKLTYLQVLYEEPYRRELDRFLAAQGSGVRWRSGSECEVARLLNLFDAKPKSFPLKHLREGSEASRFDANLDGAFFSWFMQRYDQPSGLQLVRRGMSTSERRATVCSMVLVSLSMLLFIAQALHPYLLRLLPAAMARIEPEAAKINDLFLWIVQVSLQVLGLLLAAWLAPISFNFVLPRALFSSLLAWFTLVLTSVPAFWAVEFTKKEGHEDDLRVAVHLFMVSHPYGSTLLALPILLMCSVFIMRQIGVWTSVRTTILLRGAFTTLKLFIGSFFWGALLALPIHSALRPSSDNPCTSCLLTIAIVGASAAAFLGILVELVWEDKSIAEPLEDPL